MEKRLAVGRLNVVSVYVRIIAAYPNPSGENVT